MYNYFKNPYYRTNKIHMIKLITVHLKAYKYLLSDRYTTFAYFSININFKINKDKLNYFSKNLKNENHEIKDIMKQVL